MLRLITTAVLRSSVRTSAVALSSRHQQHGHNKWTGNNSNNSSNNNNNNVTTTTSSSALPGSGKENHAEALFEEIWKLTSIPLPIGELYRNLSPGSKKALGATGTPLETLLLRMPEKFAVFQEVRSRTIMASRANRVPNTAMRGVEASAERLFDGRKVDPAMAEVLTVLRYIPNEWSPFVALNVPEEIRVRVMNRKPKQFFEKYPQYFEVQAQSMMAHTFQVRRSLALQQQQQQQQQQQK